MSDNSSPTKKTSRSSQNGWKCFFVFISAVVASIIVHSFKSKSTPAISIYLAEILGGATAYFAIAMIFASFVRGPSGTTIGVIIVCLAASFSGYETYLENKPEQDLLNALDQHQQTIAQAARTTIDRSGRMDINPSLIRDTLDDLSAKSKNLDPQTAAMTAAIVAVTSEMLKPAEEGRKIGIEIANETFLDPSSIKTRQDIDSRLNRLNAFRDAAKQLSATYPVLDIRLKAELTRRNIPPLLSKECTATFIRSAHLDIAIPLAASNIAYADILIRKFELLRDQFGAWRVKSGKIHFEDSSALRTWNATSRLLFENAEQRETLERKYLAEMERETK